MKLRTTLLLIISLLFGLGLAACSKPQHEDRHASVKQYKEWDGSNWVFWYLILGHGNTYYYHSYTPVTNFNSVTFTRSPGGVDSLPKEVQESLDKAEPQGEQVLPAEELPQEVQETEMADSSSVEMTGEAPQEFSGEPTSSTPDDSSSSFSSEPDSGGGDSGGGGGGE